MSFCSEVCGASTIASSARIALRSWRWNSSSSWHSRHSLKCASTRATSLAAALSLAIQGSRFQHSPCAPRGPVWGLCVIADLLVSAGLITASEARQRATQLFACVEHPRLHRVDRALHDLRDLLAGVAHQVRELHHHALLERQLRERLPEPLTILVLLLRVRRNSDLFDQHRSRRSVPAQRLERPPVRDADDPGRNQRVAAKVSGLQPHSPQGVIDHFLDQVVTGGHSHEETSEPAVIDQIQLFESRSIARRDLAQQLELASVRGTAAGRTK